jgi:kynurenine formamidase
MDTIAPTPERLRKDEFEQPALDRKTSRPYHRVVCTVEAMHKRGRIRDEHFRAWLEFEEAFLIGNRVTAVTIDYARVRGGGDTTSIKGPIDIRIAAFRKVGEGLRDMAADQRIALHLLASRNATLAALGHEVCRVKPGSKACIAAATKLVRAGLHRLAVNYGHLRPDP